MPVFRHFRRQFWMSQIVTSDFFFKNHNEQAHTDQTTTNAGSYYLNEIQKQLNECTDPSGKP